MLFLMFNIFYFYSDVFGSMCAVRNDVMLLYSDISQWFWDGSGCPINTGRITIIVLLLITIFFSCGAAAQRGLWSPKWLITVGRATLDERSARRRDLYLAPHNTHNRKISMLPVGFEPTISASERPQTYALDRAATETGFITILLLFIYCARLNIQGYYNKEDQCIVSELSTRMTGFINYNNGNGFQKYIQFCKEMHT